MAPLTPSVIIVQPYGRRLPWDWGSSRSAHSDHLGPARFKQASRGALNRLVVHAWTRSSNATRGPRACTKRWKRNGNSVLPSKRSADAARFFGGAEFQVNGQAGRVCRKLGERATASGGRGTRVLGGRPAAFRSIFEAGDVERDGLRAMLPVGWQRRSRGVSSINILGGFEESDNARPPFDRLRLARSGQRIQLFNPRRGYQFGMFPDARRVASRHAGGASAQGDFTGMARAAAIEGRFLCGERSGRLIWKRPAPLELRQRSGRKAVGLRALRIFCYGDGWARRHLGPISERTRRSLGGAERWACSSWPDYVRGKTAQQILIEKLWLGGRNAERARKLGRAQPKTKLVITRCSSFWEKQLRPHRMTSQSWAR